MRTEVARTCPPCAGGRDVDRDSPDRLGYLLPVIAVAGGGPIPVQPMAPGSAPDGLDFGASRALARREWPEVAAPAMARFYAVAVHPS